MEPEHIYILGAGAVGMPLAVHLANSGRRVTAVRTSTDEVESQAVEVTVRGSRGRVFKAPVEMVSLGRLKSLDGVIAVTAKTYANEAIASRLKEMGVTAPIVILQNGVGVEKLYLELAESRVYRCVLYVTGQKNSDGSCTFVPITASPIGAVRGGERELERLVDLLNTAEFPFTAQGDIQQEVWKKATINAVFNSICPLLEIDNGIFVRDEKTALLAREIVDECIAVMRSLGFPTSAEEVMQQIFTISRGSDGQSISTLQDIRSGRETEIDALNLEIARIGAAADPEVNASTTRALGELVKIKSRLRRKPGEAG